MAVDYKSAGVDIDAGARAVELMKDAVKATYTPAVLAGVGSFGGLFSAAALRDMQDPVLVASTDGVGTKTKVATRAGQLGGLGQDIVNHCVNDILVQGALPLFFLDYVATGKLVPEQVAAVVSGAAEACRRVGAALLGGETAEMPGVYLEGELDLVGTIIGAVDRPRLVDGSRLQAGDVLIGLPSSGLHTNGYSLARKILENEDWDAPRAELGGQSLSDALLVPHREYVSAYRALSAAGVDVRGMAHITGGGLIENPPRVFPEGLGAVVRAGSWPVPPLFELIVRLGEVELLEAHRALNMGIGFVFMLPAAHEAQALEVLREAGETPYRIGELEPGSGVRLEGNA
ncbi:phosphoribosylformylglycinamidine cyclo-ligase [Deinobacterium chartae]|uniref:Phosphoribosylformylglycinamidine cyclo-ligase n=1 Tax=Deinobacterium chartae TaxID=521158 RepID=A0A841HWA1_9DEIO|nr:phosphoribosylformylglycinamidine cyclo-ligase [Deinobacterium chartae]MBB6097196.1 phosphoribosylformylglycinamidine cyclo-ligase [Deinobacterium chartae]